MHCQYGHKIVLQIEFRWFSWKLCFCFYKTLLPSCRSDILVWQPMSELCLFNFFDDGCVNLMIIHGEQNTLSPVMSTCDSTLHLKDMIRNIEEILLRLILECFFSAGQTGFQIWVGKWFCKDKDPTSCLYIMWGQVQTQIQMKKSRIFYRGGNRSLNNFLNDTVY